MGFLRNPKHEAFAQALAKGSPLLAAYVLVGYRPNAPSATRLAKRVKIVNRVNEILVRKDNTMLREEVQAANSAAVNKGWVMQRMVREAETGEYASERIRALELLGKELGMFINRSVSVDISADFANLDNAEAILAAVAKELGDDTAATLRALIAPRQAAKPMRTIEHDPGETIDAESSDEPEDPVL